MGLSESILIYFSGVEDPRVEGRCGHLMLEMIFISVCAVLCGAESFSEIEEFGHQKRDWFKKFLELPNDIPSDDTFRRLFAALDPQIFSLALTNWVQSVLAKSKLSRLCFDGKTVAGTDRRVIGKHSNRLHLLNVFDQANGLALGQVPCKSTAATEPEAILECLEFLDVEGALISMDAISSRPRPLQAIRRKGADYLVPVKKNNLPTLLAIEEMLEVTSTNTKMKEETTRAHGREEKRSVSVFDANKMDSDFQQRWPDAKTIARITRTRETEDTRPLIQQRNEKGEIEYHKNYDSKRTTENTVYYVSSRKLTAAQAMKEIRSHWSIENNLHWHLDVTFKEDQWRVRDLNAAANLSTIRKFALNLVQQSTAKGSKRIKMKRAAWNNDFLEKLIGEAQF